MRNLTWIEAVRPVTITDLMVALRVLAAVPVAERRDCAESLVNRARLADRYRKRTGRCHTFGDGTLAGAARGMVRAGKMDVGDAEGRACVLVVLDALVCDRITRRHN